MTTHLDWTGLEPGYFVQCSPDTEPYYWEGGWDKASDAVDYAMSECSCARVWLVHPDGSADYQCTLACR